MGLQSRSNRVFRKPPHSTLGRGQVLQSPETPPALLQGRERSGSESEVTQMIRTVCTHFYTIKRMCQPYNCGPYTKRFHRVTDSTGVTMCGQEVTLLSQKLEVLTTEKWVLDCVQGFQIPFTSLAVQDYWPNPPISSAEQNSLILVELNTLLEKGTITSVENPSGHKGFYSTLFLVPKKGGQMRPVINFKKLKDWVEPQHFKMEGMGTLRELLRVNDWMVKVDLKDAYFTIPILADPQPYLRFIVGQEHYQFACLPFGLSCALWVFTKVMKPVAIFLRAKGCK